MSLEHVVDLECVRCKARHPADGRHTCPACGLEGILDVRYDYEKVARTLTAGALRERPLDLFRYRELLPVDDRLPQPPLKVGRTGLSELPRLARDLGVGALWVKDETRNPTGSFKDRATAIAVLKAQEQGAAAVACASTGNAGSSMAGYAAAAGLPAFIFVPQRAPAPKLAQLLIYGAKVVRVHGSYSDAFDWCQEACRRYGWYDRSCGVNPYLVEGKKTCGLELAEQIAADPPDWVAVSVGDGCTVAGIWKGLWEMKRLGLLSRLPRLLGVQASGCAPIVHAHREGGTHLTPLPENTLADSIAVGVPRNWRKALAAVGDSNGAWTAVEDAEILESLGRLARGAGIFVEPAAGAALAGVARAAREGIIGSRERVVVVVTGNGLKDVSGATAAAPSPLEVPADLARLPELLAPLTGSASRR